MRILLVHNPEAGSEEHEANEIMAALEHAGHRPVYQSSKKKGLKKACRGKIDLVLVAGGDGTVGKVAALLLGRKIPLSVLPLGTANNLARALGFLAPLKKLITRLATGEGRSFDVGRARGPWGRRHFFEGAGAGLFADYLCECKQDGRKSEEGTKTEQMQRHIRELRRRLRKYPAKKWKIELDDADYSGRYLLWHAMNIRSVGPVLKLAPRAATNDGQLDFVGAREEDRSLLLDYFAARLAGRNSMFPIPAKRFKKMRLRWKKAPLLFDDEIWPAKEEKDAKRFELKLETEAAALTIWRS